MSDWTTEKILTLTFDEFDEFRKEYRAQLPGTVNLALQPALPTSRMPPHNPLVEFQERHQA